MEFPGQSYRVPVAIAQQQGYFKDAGIDLKIIPQPNNLQGAQALTATQSQIGVLSTPTLTQGWQAGTPVQAFCGNIKVLQTSLLALPDSTLPSTHNGASPQDVLKALSGKKVGVQTPVGSGLQILFAEALKQAGVTDVTYVNIGGGNNVTQAALENHSIDVAQANPPGTQLLVANKAAKELIYMPDGVPVYADNYGSMFVGTKDWLDANPKTATGFCNAIKKAIDFIGNKSNESKVVSAVEQETGVNADVAKLILPTFKDFTTDLPTAALQKTFDEYTRLGINKPEPKLTTDALIFKASK